MSGLMKRKKRYVGKTIKERIPVKAKKHLLKPLVGRFGKINMTACGILAHPDNLTEKQQEVTCQLCDVRLPVEVENDNTVQEVPVLVVESPPTNLPVAE